MNTHVKYFPLFYHPVCLGDVENRNSLCQILRCILPCWSNTWTFSFLNWKKAYPIKFFFLAGNKYSCIQHGQPVGGVGWVEGFVSIRLFPGFTQIVFGLNSLWWGYSSPYSTFLKVLLPMTKLFLKPLMQHVGLGGEEEGKNLFKGLQLYNLALPLSVSTLPLCIHRRVCVWERYFIYSSKAVFLFARWRWAHVALNTSELLSVIILVKTGQAFWIN